MNHRTLRRLSTVALLLVTTGPLMAAPPPPMTPELQGFGSSLTASSLFAEAESTPIVRDGAPVPDVQFRTYPNGLVGPVDGSHRPDSLQAPKSVDALLVEQAGHQTEANLGRLGANLPLANPTLTCTPVAKKGSITLSRKTVPLGVTTPVTITVKDAANKVRPGVTVTLTGLADPPATTTTDAKGQASLNVLAYWASPLTLSVDQQTEPTLLFPLASDLSGVEVRVRDRCGKPAESEVTASYPRLPSWRWGENTVDGLVGFVNTDRSVFVESYFADQDGGIPHFLSTTANLQPGKVTSVLLTGKDLTPTRIEAQLDGAPATGVVYLRSAAAPGWGVYPGAAINATIVASPGKYGFMWRPDNSSGLFFKDRVSLGSGAGVTRSILDSADLGTLDLQTRVGATPYPDAIAFFLHGPLGFFASPGTRISATQGEITSLGVWVDNQWSFFFRDKTQPVTIKSKRTTALSWDLGLGAPTVTTEPTYDVHDGHTFTWQQRTADGWSLGNYGANSPTFSVQDPETAAVLESGNVSEKNWFYLPANAPPAVDLIVNRPADRFTTGSTQVIRLARNVYQLTSSAEIIRPNVVTAVTATLTKNGKPMAGERVQINNSFGEGSKPTTDRRGTVTVRVKPPNAGTLRFEWLHYGQRSSATTYALPQGWGLVEATATTETGAPIDYLFLRGSTGQDGQLTPLTRYKAMLPAGVHSIVVQGSWWDPITNAGTAYLMTTAVTVPDGGTASVAVSAANTLPLTLAGNPEVDEELEFLVKPAALPLNRFIHIWPFPGSTLRVSPGEWLVAARIINRTAGYQKIFPTITTSGDPVTVETTAAATELRVSTVAGDGRIADLTSVRLDSGGGIPAYNGVEKLLAAPGTYTITAVSSVFNGPRSWTEFDFSGTKSVTVAGETTIPVLFGGTLTGSISPSKSSYTRGETVTFDAVLTEQQGLHLDAAMTGSVGRYTPSAEYYPSLRGNGPATVPTLPLKGGTASWATTSRTRTGAYTFTYNQELKGYWTLPVLKVPVQIK